MIDAHVLGCVFVRVNGVLGEAVYDVLESNYKQYCGRVYRGRWRFPLIKWRGCASPFKFV